MVGEFFARETGCDPFSLSAEDMQVNATAQPLVCAFQLAVWAAIGADCRGPRACGL